MRGLLFAHLPTVDAVLGHIEPTILEVELLLSCVFALQVLHARLLYPYGRHLST